MSACPARRPDNIVLMLHHPALDPADGEVPAGLRRPGPDKRTEGWTLMLDGTWQAVTIAEWRKAPGGRWRVLLMWGAWGTINASWYWHDPARLAPLDPGQRTRADPGQFGSQW